MIRHLAAVALSAMVGAAPARAQLSAWLDFDGAIKGEALDSRHKDWIEIHSFNVGTSRETSVSAGGGSRDSARPAMSELGLNKFVDRATPGLFRSIVESDEPYPKATLDLTAGADQPFARLELENVLVSSQTFVAAAGGQDRPTESISLNFTKITYIYVLPDGDSLFTKYDIEKNTSESGTLPGGTDPDADSDNDGMPDWWELQYGLDITMDDSGDDPDGDGFTNLQEFQLGTNPKSGSSFFKATLTPAEGSPGSFEITWNSVAGKAYVIEWSPDLATPFSAIRTVTATAASTTETIAAGESLGFYRVRPQ